MPSLQPTTRAIGFDLGETLIEYAGLPLSWHDLYDQALDCVARTRGVGIGLLTDVGWRKPHPAGYRTLAEMLDVDPARMLFVGNERKDIEGANTAGMTSVLIDRARTGLDFGQTWTIASLDEFLKIPIVERFA